MHAPTSERDGVENRKDVGDKRGINPKRGGARRDVEDHAEESKVADTVCHQEDGECWLFEQSKVGDDLWKKASQRGARVGTSS